MRVSRRRFLKGMLYGGAASLLSVSGYSLLIEPVWVELTRVEIQVPGLPDSLTGLALVQLSDIHLSRDVSEGYVERCVRKVNQLKADLVVITGDFVTSAYRPYIEPCCELMARLEARYGVYAVLGNHDYNVYTFQKIKSNFRNAELLAEGLSRRGITVLRNQGVELKVGDGKLYLAGVDDLWAGRKDVSRALAGMGRQQLKVLLTHNPDIVEEVNRVGLDLVLAGHTHGGQVRLPLIGPLVVPSIYGARYACGLFHFGETKMYVNRGLGVVSPPVRFLVRPEITVFRFLSC